jgi:opacity protein-like surface antigen
MSRFHAVAVLALLMSFLTAAPSSAQVIPQYNTSGIQLGAYLTGIGASYEGGDETDSGGGLTFRIGYGFSRFSIFAAATGASMDSGDYTLAHFDVGGRVLLADARLRPYLQAAFTGRAAEIDVLGENLQIRGAGPSVGGGLEYAFSRTAALDVGLHYTFGKYSEGRLNNGSWEDLGAEGMKSSTARFDVGVIWRP